MQIKEKVLIFSLSSQNEYIAKMITFFLNNNCVDVL